MNHMTISVMYCTDATHVTVNLVYTLKGGGGRKVKYQLRIACLIFYIQELGCNTAAPKTLELFTIKVAKLQHCLRLQETFKNSLV